MNEQNTYYAFISYNSADEKWAKWLQHKLEYYHVPSALCKEYPELPKKIRPVFWYKQDLSGTKLKEALSKELRSSKYLIVICSPDSAKSDWVNDEVDSFIKQGKGDKIIPFIVAGNPHAKNPEEECFPSALLNLTREEEIRGIDLRRKEGKSHALVDVIATMFGVRFDELWQRHERRRKKIRNIWIAVVTVLLLLLGVYGMRMRPVVIYYSDFIECNGKPHGVEKIDSKIVKNRYVSYKFIYKRNNLFSHDRDLKRVEKINSYGKLTSNMPTYEYMIEGSIKNVYPIIELKDNNILFYDEKRNLRECWDYSTINTTDGVLLIADVKRIAIGDVAGKYSVIGERLNRANINRYCFELDENGFNKKIT